MDPGFEYHEDIDLHFQGRTIPMCDDCHTEIEGQYLAYGEMRLCSSCHDLRILVEEYLLDKIPSDPGKVSSIDIYQMMEQDYGIPVPVVASVIQRLTTIGAICRQ